MEAVFDRADFKKYKFKELKVYSSTEWLANNRKKYRQVFDRLHTSYVYAELSLFNKLFDIIDWDIQIDLRCYSLKKGRKEVCHLPIRRKVSKYDPVIYIREGWGNKAEGSFWKKGAYFWEASIEGEKVATKYFYIEEGNLSVSPEENAYVAVHSMRLYEGSYDDVPEGERTYYSAFSTEETRYIYLEIVLSNIHDSQPWQCEIFTKFYNDARELKGQVVRLQKVERNEDFIKLTAGWGSNIKGSWRADRYTVEVVFMDHLLAVVPFEVGEDSEVGNAGVLLPNSLVPVLLEPDEIDHRTFDEVMTDLDKLIGLKEIKQQVRDHAQYIQFLQLRKEVGFDEKEKINVHSVFSGNPGTGKTTVAVMMGKLYQKMGLLSKGHVHVVDRVDLVGEYIGQTAPKVKEAIEKARGGVLFIDEAYSLARSQDDTKDFGREVIEILVKEMSNGVGDLAVIVAGYPKEMGHFLDSNPGLKSRFKLFFEFSDYLPQELSQIGRYAAEHKEVQFDEKAWRRIDDLIVAAFRTRDRTFGNARWVFDLIEKAKINLGLRIMGNIDPRKLEKDQLANIYFDDVDKIKLVPKRDLPHIPVDEVLLEEALNELNRLIGMSAVKAQIREMTRLVRFYRESRRDVLNGFSLHTVFVGNPGTGKTTVARILTKIYKALGILERGHMIETDRQGLVAGYVGQTAIKTTERIEEAMGGVLFIDEAYALSMRSSHMGDFGDEAIQTLLKRMEDDRGSFFVFVAGYPDNMEQFLKVNPGLNSRFDKILRFEDYKPEELSSIATLMLSQEGYTPAPDAEVHLDKYLAFSYKFRDKYFGNARHIRAIVQEIIKQHNLRLAALSLADREINQNIINLADVKGLELNHNNAVFQRKGIGFRQGNS